MYDKLAFHIDEMEIFEGNWYNVSLQVYLSLSHHIPWITSHTVLKEYHTWWLN